jgi:hypothetical protein
MTYAEHLALMTQALVDVARHGQHDLAGPELDIALLSRRNVLELLTTVHESLTGLGLRREISRISDLEAHPVEALGQSLRRHPRPDLDHAPSDALLLPATTPAGIAWREAGRHALLAHHHWTTGHGTEPDHATTWAGVADVAAICRQLAVLDVELADTLHTAGRQPRARILVARSAADLPATHRRLAEFLDAAENIRPERLGHLATAIARCTLIARDQLPPGDPTATALRGELREHARLLQRVTERPGGLVSLEPGDLRSLRQAVEAFQGARRHGPGLAADRRLLADYVDAIGVSTRALSGVVNRSIGGRRWLVPDRGTSLLEPAWIRLRPSAPAPYPVLALRAADAHGDVLRDCVAGWLAPSAPAQVRAVLAQAAGRVVAHALSAEEGTEAGGDGGPDDAAGRVGAQIGHRVSHPCLDSGARGGRVLAAGVGPVVLERLAQRNEQGRLDTVRAEVAQQRGLIPGPWQLDGDGLADAVAGDRHVASEAVEVVDHDLLHRGGRLLRGVRAPGIGGGLLQFECEVEDAGAHGVEYADVDVRRGEGVRGDKGHPRSDRRGDPSTSHQRAGRADRVRRPRQQPILVLTHLLQLGHRVDQPLIEEAAAPLRRKVQGLDGYVLGLLPMWTDKVARHHELEGPPVGRQRDGGRVSAELMVDPLVQRRRVGAGSDYLQLAEQDGDGDGVAGCAVDEVLDQGHPARVAASSDSFRAPLRCPR